MYCPNGIRDSTGILCSSADISYTKMSVKLYVLCWLSFASCFPITAGKMCSQNQTATLPRNTPQLCCSSLPIPYDFLICVLTCPPMTSAGHLLFWLHWWFHLTFLVTHPLYSPAVLPLQHNYNLMYNDYFQHSHGLFHHSIPRLATTPARHFKNTTNTYINWVKRATKGWKLKVTEWLF